MNKLVYFAGSSANLCAIAMALADVGLHSITHFEDADALMQALKDRRLPKPDVLIVDVALPHGEMFQDFMTSWGSRTGIVVYDEVRQMFPEMAMVIYSTSTLQELAMLCDPNLRVFQNRPFRPVEVACLASNALSHAPPQAIAA